MKTQFQLMNQHTRNLRRAAMAYLGNQCKRCGFNDIRALQFDHVTGITGKRVNPARMYHEVMEDSKEYQLLCANCNWIKRSEQQEQPGYVKRRKLKIEEVDNWSTPPFPIDFEDD